MVKTLLFTDVVDSTKLTQELGDQRMAEIWIRHDDIARDLMKTHNGLEIDRTDGFFVLFDAVHDAILFANDLHNFFAELSEEEGIDFQSRIGIHSGHVILVKGSKRHDDIRSKKIEVEGISKPTAARLMSLACGGQTLLSFEAMSALKFKDEFFLKSHGYWRLKGVEQPIELFEVRGEEGIFLPPKDTEKAYRVYEKSGIYIPVREMNFFLPAERNTFIGRQSELIKIRQLFDSQTKLITISGTGGVGKSRLARYFGWRWLGEYEGGAWFCNLVEARTIDGIVSAVASTLNVPLGKGDPVKQLGFSFQGRGKCLIILDNFEQIIQFASQTIEIWLEMAPEVCFMVTSREILNIVGEQILSLEPLPVESEAVQLFEARAKSRKVGFQLVPENKSDVESIVAILEGMPLAIELAAARISILNPKQIKDRLKDKFKLLSGIKGTEKRHQALRYTIDWSWEMLKEWEKSTLAQCSSFEGGFTLDAAESVIDISGIGGSPLLIDVIQSLVDKSLLRSDVQRYDMDEMWYGMYISINEYSSEKLRMPESFKGSGIEFEMKIWERHSDYYAQFGTDEFVELLKQHGGEERRRAMVEDLDNLFAALSRSISKAFLDQASHLFSAVWQVIIRQGPYQIIKHPAERVLSLLQTPDNNRLRALKVVIASELEIGSLTDADRFVEEALNLSTRLGDEVSEVGLLVDQGTIALYKSEYEKAEISSKAAINLAELIGYKQGKARALNLFGSLCGNMGKLSDSLHINMNALEIAQEIGDLRMEGNLLNNLAVTYSDQAKYDEAKEYFERALLIAQKIRNRLTECVVLGNFGNTLANLGFYKDAAKHTEKGLEISLEMGTHNHEAFLLLTLGNIHLCHGDNELSKHYFERGLNLAIKTGNKRNEGAIMSYLGHAYFNLGQTNTAKEYYINSDKILKEFNIRPYECTNLLRMATVARVEGNYATAMNLSEQAKKIAKAIGFSDVEAMIDSNIANIFRDKGQYLQALKTYEKVSKALHDLNAKLPLAELLVNWSEAYFLYADFKKSKEKIELASKIIKELDLKPGSPVRKNFEKIKASYPA